MPNLVLYERQGCPYSQKVLDFMRQKNITVIRKDIGRNDADRKELLRIGGKQQVPCLVIDGKPMYESNEIIKWLETNFTS